MAQTDIERLIVTLEASTKNYERGLAQANKTTVSALRKIERDIQTSATRQQALFTRMSGRLKTALVGLSGGFLGGISGGLLLQKGARDFRSTEQALTKIVTLVGIARKELDTFRPTIARLAGESGKSPTELADALFFVTSAGLRGQAALDALGAAAKGSAIGLGQTKTVADAATSALNAYAGTNLTAEKSVAILVASVREGKAEADAIAGAIGKVIPVAAALGVRFDEVGASIAAMTKLGTSADQAATQLGAILQVTLRPTKEAADALAEVGLSAEALRKSLKERGLLATLELLTDRLGGNTDAIAKVLGNVEALRGVLNLLGNNAEATRQTFAALARTTEDDLNKAFNEWADTTDGKLSQALGKLDIELQRLGAVTLPGVATVAGRFTDQLEDMRSKAQAVKDVLAALFALVPDLGPDMDATMERLLARHRGPEFERVGRGAPPQPVIVPPPFEPGVVEKDSDKKLNEFERANEAIKRRIALLEIEAQVFGKSTFEAEKARIAFELLEAAKAANIPITRTLREQIEELATAYGNAAAKITALEEAEKAAAKAAEDLARVQEESIRRMEELRDAGTDSMKGFVRDLIDGKSAADALNNAMQRLADRLIDMGLDSIFGSIFGGGPGSQFGNFGLFGSFQPNTGAGGSPASPAYVWVVNGGVGGATGGGGFLSGLFGGTSTPALAAASPSGGGGNGWFIPNNLQRPALLNPDGSFSTEETITIGDPGSFFNIPTIVGGVRRSDVDATRLFQQGMNPAVGGPFSSLQDAIDSAIARSNGIGLMRELDSPIPVEVKTLPTLSTSGLLSGDGGTQTLTGGNFFDDMAKSVQSFPDFSASTPTNSSTFFKDDPTGVLGVNPVPANQFSGFTLDDIVDPTFTSSVQSSAERITSGADTLADSVGTAATSGKQFADGVTDVGSTAQSSAGQFSSQFPQAMQQIIQSITSAGGSTPFGGFPGGPFFGSFSSFGGASGFTPGVVLSRQHGGPVDANRPYIVGERGQELFVPKTSGFIVPDIEGFMKAMKRIDHARSGGGRPITQTNNFITPTIADRRSQNQMARRAVDDLTRSQRTS